MVGIHAGDLREVAVIIKLYLTQCGVRKAPYYLALTIFVVLSIIISIILSQESLMRLYNIYIQKAMSILRISN